MGRNIGTTHIRAKGKFIPLEEGMTKKKQRTALFYNRLNPRYSGKMRGFYVK